MKQRIGLLTIALLLALGSIGVYALNGVQANLALAEKSDAVELRDAGIGELSITPDATYNEQGAYLTYRLTLTNEDGTNYRIASVTDDNKSTVMGTAYSYEGAMDTADKGVDITLSYDNVTNTGTPDVAKITATITLEEEAEEPDVPPTPAPDPGKPGKILPITGDSALLVSALAACLLGLALMSMTGQKKQIKTTVLIVALGMGLALAPNLVFAQPGGDVSDGGSTGTGGGETQTLTFTINLDKVALAKFYTVTFDTDGGEPAIESQIVKGGDKALEPATPKKLGYAMPGWTKADGAVFDFDTPITEDTALKAKWNQCILTVQLDGQEGNTFGKNISRSSFESVAFVDTREVPAEAMDSWDASAAKDESVIAWYTDADGDGLYELYIGGEGKVFANPNSYAAMQRFRKAETMDFTYFDTSLATTMNWMFGNANAVKNLDLSGFDTSKVTSMTGMFNNCNVVDTIDVSGWDTSQVTDMSMMFNNCYAVKNLDVSSFDTGNVRTMQHMFYNTFAIETLDLSNFDTKNVTSMAYMFGKAAPADVGGRRDALVSVDISSFTTDKVISMAYMFGHCHHLKELDLSHFNTPELVSMDMMFYCCFALENLDVSSFDTSNVVYMNNTFNACQSVRELDVSGFDTSNVTGMNNLFGLCMTLRSLDLSSFDTSKVRNMHGLLQSCNNLEEVDMGEYWEVDSVVGTGRFTGLQNMFLGSPKIKTTLNLKGVPTYYPGAFQNAATAPGAQIIVNYTDPTNVDDFINTKSSNSNVVKGQQIPPPTP